MKINNKLFSLPPYISTSWNHVSALHVKGASLVVSLNDGESVIIPDVKPDLLEVIFNAHAAFLEEKAKEKQKPQQRGTLFSFLSPQNEGGAFEFPLKFGIGNFENWAAALQHNPAQGNLPSLPEEVLEKIRSIAKLIIPEDPQAAPKAEPHCNCMYCQIARAINQGLGITDIFQKNPEKGEEKAEEVSEIDLHFQQWEIEQKDEKLYTVTNRLDKKEQYSVFLGHPIGCTCGNEGCEHIVAVLKS